MSSTALRTDFCYRCNSFGTVIREKCNNQRYCLTCVIEVRKKIQEKINIKKDNKTLKKELPERAIKNNACFVIKKLFLENEEKTFTSKELVNMYKDTYSYHLVMGALGYLCQRKIIYSRTVCVFRNGQKNIHAVYSTKEEKVKQLFPEETSYQIRSLLKQNNISKSKDLIYYFQISQKNILKIIKKWLKDEVIIYCFKNAYYYFHISNIEVVEQFVKTHPGSKYVKLNNTI